MGWTFSGERLGPESDALLATPAVVMGGRYPALAAVIPARTTVQSSLSERGL